MSYPPGPDTQTVFDLLKTLPSERTDALRRVHDAIRLTCPHDAPRWPIDDEGHTICADCGADFVTEENT